MNITSRPSCPCTYDHIINDPNIQTMNQHNYCVIMVGGAGPSFWPLSRSNRPFPFLAAAGNGKSFLRHTYDRLIGLVPKENILVVTLRQYKTLVQEDIPEIPESNILLEPYGRGTAPCIALSTYTILKRDPEAVVLVAPADNFIETREGYSGTLGEAFEYAASHDALITVGIVPDKPDTNFGYIQAEGGSHAYDAAKPVKIKTFTEKPDFELAKVFFESGEFLWNSGIFIWKAQVIREEMERLAPGITSIFTGWENALGSENEKSFLEKAYMNLEGISIDYAIMEKTEKGWVYPADFHWASISNWDTASASLSNNDPDGNALHLGHQLLFDCKNDILVSSEDDKLVAVSGLENYIVINTPDVLMICPRDEAHLKDITSRLGLPEFEEFR